MQHTQRNLVLHISQLLSTDAAARLWAIQAL